MGEGDLSLQFSRGDEEIAELFTDIGVRRHAARVLVLLLRDIDLTSREMERICDLRQPEVSIALTDLIDRKWVKKVSQKAENKGRPVLIYHLSRKLDDILDQLKNEIVGDYDEKVKEIEKVREMLRVKTIEKN